MTNAARAVLAKALRLDPVERAEIIDRLFRSFEAVPDARREAAWAKEAESRIDAHQAGEIPADPASTALARISKRKR